MAYHATPAGHRCAAFSPRIRSASAARPAPRDPIDVAAAKKEGKVVWYTSTPIATANKIVKVFESETGVKVELFRSGGSAVLRRFMQEQQAGHIAADVLTTSDPGRLRRARAQGHLRRRSSRTISTRCRPTPRTPNGAHVAQRLN